LASEPHPLRGFIYIATATFLWGISATLGRAAFTGRLFHDSAALASIGPLILSQSRVTFSFLVLLPVIALAMGREGLTLPKIDIGRTFLLGVVGNAATNFFYYLAIERTGVATAIGLQYTVPVWVLLYAVLRGRQKLASGRALAVLLAITGITLVVGLWSSSGIHSGALGIAAGLISALSYAFNVIYGHSILARHNRFTVLLYTTLGASLFWLLVNPPWKVVAAHHTANQWLFLLIFGVVSFLLPLSFYFAGLKHLEPTRAIVVSCLEPVFSILIAAIVLGEKVSVSQGVGIAFVLGASVLAQLPPRKVAEHFPT
jgi:DME family drug/metabolite transporter